MRSKIKMLNRFKITFNRFIKTKPLVLVQCNYCESFDLDFKVLVDYEEVYASEYKCNVCGATCVNTERWSKQ